MYNDGSAQIEADKLIRTIKDFWSNKVNNIKILELRETPFDFFVLSMNFYNKYEVLMEYDRSTLSIKIKNSAEYTVLSRISNKKVYRGFESYIPENILHNFKVLDDVLTSPEI